MLIGTHGDDEKESEKGAKVSNAERKKGLVLPAEGSRTGGEVSQRSKMKKEMKRVNRREEERAMQKGKKCCLLPAEE